MQSADEPATPDPGGPEQSGPSQPGLEQLETQQLETQQPGTQPAGTQPVSAVQPGAVQAGAVQSGAVQSGAVQPGADSVGATVAAARNAAGLTVDDVSERTRIRASLIEQIEREDFSGCGGTVYARGHLRSIATTLGLDPAPLLAAYDAGHEAVPSPVVVTSPDFNPLNGGGAGRRRGGFQWAPAMIASLVVVCALALVALLLPSGGDDKDDTAAAPSAPPSVAPAAPATPPPAPTPSQSSRVNVRIQAQDAQSWLEVSDERQNQLVALLLQRGDSREVSSEGALEIKMGNAGAVALSCNGHDLGRAGGPGEVVTIRLALAESGGGCTVGGDDATGLAAAGPAATSRSAR